MMMVINFPDMGFSNSQNINIPDKFYTNIKDNVVRCIQNARLRREASAQSMICHNGEGTGLNLNNGFNGIDVGVLLQGSTSLVTQTQVDNKTRGNQEPSTASID